MPHRLGTSNRHARHAVSKTEFSIYMKMIYHTIKQATKKEIIVVTITAAATLVIANILIELIKNVVWY